MASLEWDETNKNLIALVLENFGEGGSAISRVARIDPITFEVTAMGIDVDRAHIMSTLLKGDKLYASSYRTGTGSGKNEFFEINLTNGALTTIDLSGFDYAPIRLSKNESSNNFFGFLPMANTGFAGASQPALINVSTGTVSVLWPDELTGNRHLFGRSFYNVQTKEHVDLITSPTYISLFQYNRSSGEIVNTKLPIPNQMGTSVTIIGAVPKI